jgi:hypothetical protein
MSRLAPPPKHWAEPRARIAPGAPGAAESHTPDPCRRKFRNSGFYARDALEKLAVARPWPDRVS